MWSEVTDDRADTEHACHHRRSTDTDGDFTPTSLTEWCRTGMGPFTGSLQATTSAWSPQSLMNASDPILRKTFPHRCAYIQGWQHPTPIPTVVSLGG